MTLAIGTMAPDFTLPSSQKEMVTLSSFRGKNVALFFFPAAFSGVCTKEVCSVQDDLAFYSGLDAQPIAISVDMPFSLDEFQKKTGATSYPFLSDFNKTVIRDYGVYREDFAMGMHGVAERAVFLIDAKGVIRWVWVGENPGIVPPFDEIKKALKTL